MKNSENTKKNALWENWNEQKKFHFNRIAFLFPIIFYAAYAVVYLIIFPNAYGTGLHLNNWLFNNPDHLLAILQNPGKVILSTGKLWAWKILLYILWIGFIASLFYLGWTLQNKRQEYNPQSVLRDREPYLKAMQINEKINRISIDGIKEVKIAVRNVMGHLRNESAFGFGNDSVIACEHEIAKSLKKIENNISELADENTAEKAKNVVMENCVIIQAQLKIRTERKKR